MIFTVPKEAQFHSFPAAISLLVFLWKAVPEGFPENWSQRNSCRSYEHLTQLYNFWNHCSKCWTMCKMKKCPPNAESSEELQGHLETAVLYYSTQTHNLQPGWRQKCLGCCRLPTFLHNKSVCLLRAKWELCILLEDDPPNPSVLISLFLDRALVTRHKKHRNGIHACCILTFTL